MLSDEVVNTDSIPKLKKLYDTRESLGDGPNPPTPRTVQIGNYTFIITHTLIKHKGTYSHTYTNKSTYSHTYSIQKNIHTHIVIFTYKHAYIHTHIQAYT